MSRYNRILYILVGTTAYHEWEDFSSAIAIKALSNKGKAATIDRAKHASALNWMKLFADPANENMITIIKINIDDVTNKGDFSYISDYIWCVHNSGNPGKIVILGHGSLTAEIGAHTNDKKTSYLGVPQKDFIETVFPDWPPPCPAGINNPISDPGVEGLKTIALRQCYAARTNRSYVSKDPTTNAHMAATGSAADITANTLRTKGWAASGITLTASPEYNVFFTQSGEIEMSTLMPTITGTAAAQTITFPKSHQVVTESGKSYITTRIRFLTPNGITTKQGTDNYWKADAASSVSYPEHWIIERPYLTWKIHLPEYVTADPNTNSISSLVPVDKNSMNLKKTNFKVRMDL